MYQRPSVRIEYDTIICTVGDNNWARDNNWALGIYSLHMKFLLIIEIGICRTKDDLSIFVIKFYPSVVARLRKASAQLLSRAQLLSPTVYPIIDMIN